MASKPRYYWDACAWIALIQQERGRFENLKHIIEQAKAGSVEIWTSMFTLAEVYKRPCGAETQSALAPDQDTTFEAYILQNFVQRVQVDFAKPQDGIHLATALLNNVDEFHTYDRENLLGLTGQIPRADGVKLLIKNPPKPPAPARAAAPLLAPLEKEEDEAKESPPAANEKNG